MRDPRQQLQRTSNRQTEKPARQQRRCDRQFSCRVHARISLIEYPRHKQQRAHRERKAAENEEIMLMTDLDVFEVFGSDVAFSVLMVCTSFSPSSSSSLSN